MPEIRLSYHEKNEVDYLVREVLLSAQTLSSEAKFAIVVELTRSFRDAMREVKEDLVDNFMAEPLVVGVVNSPEGDE